MIIKSYGSLILTLGIAVSAFTENTNQVIGSSDTTGLYLVLGRVTEVKPAVGLGSPPEAIEGNDQGGVIRVYTPLFMNLITFRQYRLFFVTNGMASEITTSKIPVVLLTDQSVSIRSDTQKLALFYAEKFNPSSAFIRSNGLDGKLILKVSWEKGVYTREGTRKFDSTLKHFKISLPTNSTSIIQTNQTKRFQTSGMKNVSADRSP